MKDKQPLEQVPLDRVTQTIYARIHAAVAPQCEEIARGDEGADVVEGLFATFQEALPGLELPGYNAMRGLLAEVAAALHGMGRAPFSSRARALAVQLAGHDLPRVAAIATKLNEEEAPKFFAAFRGPDSAFGHFAIDAKKRTTIGRAEFDAAIEGIVNRRLKEAALLIKEDTAAWFASQGVVGETVVVAGDGSGPRYALRIEAGIWKIVFDGRSAEWKDEKGMQYAAYLMKSPPAEPIYGTKLAALVFGHADVPELSLGKDGPASQRAIETEARDLAAVMASGSATEMEKEEARQRLEELSRVRKEAGRRPESNAEKAVRAVRKSIQRLQKKLAARKDGQGKPHPVLAPFAEHLEKHLLRPSARFGLRKRGRVRAGVAGCFTYEPPEGVRWTG